MLPDVAFFMFLNSINHFRAIAIIIIVAGHCFPMVDASFNTLPERMVSNLVNGGTVMFVFISGFLFHHIFYERYQFKKFMMSKLNKVLLPYTLLSILPIVGLVLKGDAFYSLFDPQGTGPVNEYLIPAMKYYFTGAFLTAYWYIPFAMILFLMSPLHMAFIRLSFNRQRLITFLLFVVSLFLHRPVHDLLIMQAVVYFTPVYLLGIICSQKKAVIYDRLEGREFFFLSCAIALAMMQAAYGLSGNYNKPPLAYAGIDLMLIQKVSLCFFFMVWLHRFEYTSSKVMSVLASTSFAIYFTHGYFITFIRQLKPMVGFGIIESPWIWYPFVTVGMVGVCLLLTLTVKKLLPNYSRYIIGY